MANIGAREKALLLRKSGYSYSDIKNKIGISKSTLSGWLSGIPYIPNEESLEKIRRARILASLAKRRGRIESIKEAKKLAINDVGNFSKRDLFMLGIGIYIGEGSKTNNIIRVVNSDLRIIKTTIKWFKLICGLQNNNFSIRIHLYPDNKQSEALKFWSKGTGLPTNSFRKVYVDNRSGKKAKNKGKLPYGTAHLSIMSFGEKEFGVFLFRRILFWIDVVYKKCGIG